MMRNERLTAIVNILKTTGSASVASMVEALDCSRETVRRDLDLLEKRGLVTKIHGGAVLAEDTTAVHSNFSTRKNVRRKEKTEIALRAVDLVREESIVAMNAGSSTYYLARELKERFSRLSVITYSLPIVAELLSTSGFSVLVPGGALDGDEQALVGPLTEQALRQFHIDVAFVAPEGVSLQGGITEYMNNELPIERLLVERSDTTYIIAEHQKLESTSLLKVCDITDVAGIITDSACPEELQERYRAAGANLLVAAPASVP